MDEEQYQSIPLERLELDPYNLRRTYRGIEQLATSILEHGLLQNLVVRPHPTTPDIWVVSAGNRRLKALKLIQEGYRPKGLEHVEFPDYVRCLVSTDGQRLWEQTVENVQREEVPIWELGARYAEMCDLGVSRSEIAARIGKASGHVGRAIRIHEGLHPSVVKKLRQLPLRAITENSLLRIANMPKNEFDEPDEDKQLKQFDFLLSRGNFRPREKRKFNPRKDLANRFTRLKRAQVPKEHYPTYAIIVAYLAGEIQSLDWDNTEVQFK